MVVGMAAAILQGGVIVTDGVDLWIENPADSKFHDAVATSGGIYLPHAT